MNPRLRSLAVAYAPLPAATHCCVIDAKRAPRKILGVEFLPVAQTRAEARLSLRTYGIVKMMVEDARAWGYT